MYKLKQIYGSTAAFYRQDLGSVVFTAGWAFAGIVVLSFIGSLLFPAQADGIVEQFAQMLQQSGMASDDGNVVFSALLLNNLSAMVMATVYGLLPFIRLPALALGVNGATLGLFAGYYVHQGIPLWKYLTGILPHGIFEIPALILSAALGLYLCRTVSDALLGKQTGSVGAAVWADPAVVGFAADCGGRCNRNICNTRLNPGGAITTAASCGERSLQWTRISRKSRSCLAAWSSMRTKCDSVCPPTLITHGGNA